MWDRGLGHAYVHLPVHRGLLARRGLRGDPILMRKLKFWEGHLPKIPHQEGTEQGLKSGILTWGSALCSLQAAEQLHGFPEDQPGAGGQAAHAGNLSRRAAWLALHSQHSTGLGLARGPRPALGSGGGGCGGEAPAMCRASQGRLDAHTVSLLSSSPHAATVTAVLFSQASLSHSWIFAVASEFVCFLPCPCLLLS